MEPLVDKPTPIRKRILVVGTVEHGVSLRIAKLAAEHDAIVEYQELKEGEKPHAIAEGFNPNPPKVTIPYKDFGLYPSDGKSHSKYARSATQAELDAPKVGRNEPCPCGSGKKFKKCCSTK